MKWIFLLLLSAGAVFVYRYLVTLEREIRFEIGSGDKEPADEKRPNNTVGQSVSVQAVSLDQRLLSVIKASPGVVQTALYAAVQDVDKKLVQKELLLLDRTGKISRIRSGNSYQLYLTD